MALVLIACFAFFLSNSEINSTMHRSWPDDRDVYASLAFFST